MTETELEYLARDFISFKDGTYRWVDIKHFRLPPGVAEQDILAPLIAHVQYRDHYASGDSHDHPTENLHGPYWLDGITPWAFEAVDEQTALRTVSDFAANLGDGGPAIVPDIVARLDSEVCAPIRTMPIRYRLKDLGKEALHDWGWVLHDFNELVLLDPAARRLDLVVAAID